MPRLFVAALAAALAMSASMARADVMTSLHPLGTSAAPAPIASAAPVVDLARFDSSLGVLTEAYVVVEGELVPSLLLPGQDASHTSFGLGFHISFDLGGGATDTAGKVADLGPIQSDEHFPPYPSDVSAGALTGYPFFIEELVFLDPATVLGSASSFTIGPRGSTTLGSSYPPGLDTTGAQDETGFYGTFDLIYIYDVPEPPAAAILLALAALLFARRHRERACPDVTGRAR